MDQFIIKRAYEFRFVDRDMLMRFHFGLGVGHVYSHHRSTQAEEGNGVRAGVTRDAMNDTIDEDADDDEDDEEEDDEENEEDEEDNEDEDSTDGELTLEQRFSASDESLLSQFGQMYGSELEIDYEN
jgi:hypothetical protein